MKIDYLKNLFFLISRNRLIQVVFIFVVAFVLQLSLVSTIHAGGLGSVSSGLTVTGNTAGLKAEGDLPTVAGRVIGQGLSIVGILLLAYLLYGGFYWMTARGDEGKVKTALGIIRNALTGIVIIALSFVIAQWVVGSLDTAITGASTTSE